MTGMEDAGSYEEYREAVRAQRERDRARWEGTYDGGRAADLGLTVDPADVAQVLRSVRRAKFAPVPYPVASWAAAPFVVGPSATFFFDRPRDDDDGYDVLAWRVWHGSIS